MARRSVMIEMTHTTNLEAAVRPRMTTAEVAPLLRTRGITIDAAFVPVELPPPGARRSNLESLFAPREASTYIVRGSVDEAEIDGLAAPGNDPSVVGVFSDPPIAPFQMPTCAGSAPVGTAASVETLLCVPALQARGLDGTGVLVAIVDTGFNLAYLRARGKRSTFDATLSWSADPSCVPGAAAVNHGTMCAFDAQIAAPACTLIDLAVLLPTAATFFAVLTDALRAYDHLRTTVMPGVANGQYRALVVNNSWGMYHPSWDFPVGHPGNYSDNANHPFNRIVGSLERDGADILFAAGNCGAPCPDGRCLGQTVRSIYGANSHPQVLTVAGVDTTRTRVGYSSQGPGRLAADKPDLAAYTHFAGSGVYAADGGTSAATPVCSGVVAALRSGLPFQVPVPAASPAAMRALLIAHAQPGGFNVNVGAGILDGCALAAQVPAAPPAPPVFAAVDVTAGVEAEAAPEHHPLGPSPVEK